VLFCVSVYKEPVARSLSGHDAMDFGFAGIVEKSRENTE